MKRIQYNDIIQIGSNAYYVSSVHVDRIYETMVFKYDAETESVKSWASLYSRRYRTEDEMGEGHKYTCENLESLLNSNNEEEEVW